MVLVCMPARAGRLPGPLPLACPSGCQSALCACSAAVSLHVDPRGLACLPCPSPPSLGSAHVWPHTAGCRPHLHCLQVCAEEHQRYLLFSALTRHSAAVDLTGPEQRRVVELGQSEGEQLEGALASPALVLAIKVGHNTVRSSMLMGGPLFVSWPPGRGAYLSEGPTASMVMWALCWTCAGHLGGGQQLPLPRSSRCAAAASPTHPGRQACLRSSCYADHCCGTGLWQGHVPAAAAPTSLHGLS